jgi:hypothetical protein
MDSTITILSDPTLRRITTQVSKNLRKRINFFSFSFPSGCQSWQPFFYFLGVDTWSEE